MPNERQALEMLAVIGGVAAAAGLAARLRQQTHPFVCADGLDIDAGTLRETGDRGGGKVWHGAGVAFDVTIKCVPNRNTIASSHACEVEKSIALYQCRVSALTRRLNVPRRSSL
jgi:hypothetical protein